MKNNRIIKPIFFNGIWILTAVYRLRKMPVPSPRKSTTKMILPVPIQSSKKFRVLKIKRPSVFPVKPTHNSKPVTIQPSARISGIKDSLFSREPEAFWGSFSCLFSFSGILFICQRINESNFISNRKHLTGGKNYVPFPYE